MAIRDVSKQWAALMESEAAADKEYTEACESACEAIDKAKEEEIDEFDEETIDPSECGFAEDEIPVDEVVDPMQMWKDLKKDAPKKANVKVDQKYIDTMKKLLSKIKSSKAQLYSTVMAKLNAYKAAGTELPPPEDYAENFVPFEMIQKIIGGKEDSPDDHVDGDDDEKMLAGRKYATDRSAAELGDTANPFGNADAEANLYDSEITEDEAEDAKKKAGEIIKKEMKASATEEEMKKWYEENKSKLSEQISKIKDAKTQETLKKLVKFFEKFIDGKVDEAELDEAAKGHKAAAIAKGIFKILKIVLGCGLIGIAVLGFCASKLGKAIDEIGTTIGKKMMESLALEVCDEDEAKEKADAEELAEDGCSVKEAGGSVTVSCSSAWLDDAEVEESKKEFTSKYGVDAVPHMNDDYSSYWTFTGPIDKVGKLIVAEWKVENPESLEEVIEDDDERKLIEDWMKSKKVNEADDREPASHLLDAVGVKASTANLKAQDTAMISVVEMLMKKVEKLENKLNESADEEKVDESASGQLDAVKAVIKGLMKNGSGECVEYASRLRDAFNLKEADEDLPDGPDKWDFDDEGMTAEDKKNYEEAVKIQDISYRRELTKAEEDKFRALLDKLPDVAKDHLLSNTMGPAGFARPGDIPLVDDPTVHPDDGGGNGMGGFGKAKVDFDKKVPIPPFNYKQGSHRPSSAEERKAERERFNKEQEKKRLAGRFPARGKKDANGEKGIWSGNEWKAMVASLTPAEKKELLDSIIEEIKAEGKAEGKDARQIASEVAFTKEHFGDKLDSRDFAQMLYGVTDFDDIEKKRVGIDKFARETVNIIAQAFKDEEDPKKVAELLRINLNSRNKRSKIAKTPLIHGDDPTHVKDDPLKKEALKSESEEAPTVEEVAAEADDIVAAQEFFEADDAKAAESKEDDEKKDEETK